MVWNDPPKFIPSPPKKGKVITPEEIAKGGSEHASQSALFAWAAMNVGKYPALAYMFAIPNGGLRDVRTASSLKAEGVKAGVPDIFLPVPIQTEWAKQYAGLFLELKVGKNKPTIEQRAWLFMLDEMGYYCKVCYSWTEAKDIIVQYLELKL